MRVNFLPVPFAIGFIRVFMTPFLNSAVTVAPSSAHP